MAEYIDRQAAIDALEEKRQYLLEQDMAGAEHVLVHLAINVIKDLPSAEPERKKGKWIEDDDGCLCCSLCGNPCEINCITGEFLESPFCSQCGAEMVGET